MTRSVTEILNDWGRMKEEMQRRPQRESKRLPEAPVVYEEMSTREIVAAMELSRVSVGYWQRFDSRFIAAMAKQARSDEPKITLKQRYHLWRTVWKYRRQVSEGLVGIVVERMAEAEERVRAELKETETAE